MSRGGIGRGRVDMRSQKEEKSRVDKSREGGTGGHQSIRLKGVDILYRKYKPHKYIIIGSI